MPRKLGSSTRPHNGHDSPWPTPWPNGPSVPADATRSASQQTSNGYMLTQSATWSGLRGCRPQSRAAISYRRLRLAYLRLRAWTALRLLLSRLFCEGLHYALFLRADMGQRWMLIAKLSVTDYFDRDHISSGLQQIDRSSKADLELSVTTQIVSQSHLCCASTVYMPSFQPGFVPRIKNGLYTLTLTRTGVTSKISL